jgi:hypothetical protein
LEVFILRTIQVGLARPISYPVDPNAIFEGGMVAQLRVIGNDVVMGVSDGTAPFGLIDDNKTVAFSKSVIDEIVIIKAPVVQFDGYNFVLGADTMAELAEGPLVPDTFVSDYPDLQVSNKGNVLALAGTKLNYTLPGSPTPNAIKTKVRYAYYIPNQPGEDTTKGSSRVTVWCVPGIILQTDIFEMVPYSVNATLYVSPNGKLTTEKTIPNQPGIGIVIVPPTAHNPVLEFMWKG